DVAIGARDIRGRRTLRGLSDPVYAGRSRHVLLRPVDEPAGLARDQRPRRRSGGVVATRGGAPFRGSRLWVGAYRGAKSLATSRMSLTFSRSSIAASASVASPG